jgi:conjugative relaxase-like TrwC/TraI family protein
LSLLAAGSSPEVRAEVQAARHAAIRKVLGWLEQEAIGVRRGHNGVDRFRGSGITAAAFDHRTSREGDPQWHTHVLVQKATLGPDQRWSALDSRKLYAHAMTADRLYHAVLRAELTRRLDVRWRPVDQRSGAAEIEGIPDSSTRGGNPADRSAPKLTGQVRQAGSSLRKHRDPEPSRSSTHAAARLRRLATRRDEPALLLT